MGRTRDSNNSPGSGAPARIAADKKAEKRMCAPRRNALRPPRVSPAYTLYGGAALQYRPEDCLPIRKRAGGRNGRFQRVTTQQPATKRPPTPSEGPPRRARSEVPD